jgi:hypothetical protein
MPSATATAPVRPRRVGRRLLAAVPLALLLTACGAADPDVPDADFPVKDGDEVVMQKITMTVS